MVVSDCFPQTNVQGIIDTNTTWSLSNSPYFASGTITILNGATLTIENGVEVQFSSHAYYIVIGYNQNSKGNLIENGVLFRGLQSNDSKIYIKDGSASGSIANCIFDNT